MRVIEYKLVISDNLYGSHLQEQKEVDILKELQEKVNTLIHQGWSPLGGASYTASFGGGFGAYFGIVQAMVLYSAEDTGA